MRRSFYRLFALFIIQCLVVCKSTAQKEKTLLWEITERHSGQHSYLYGTFHSQDRRIFELGAPVVSALKSVDAIATETDITPESIAANIKSCFMSGNLSIKNLVDSGDYKSLYNYTTGVLGNYPWFFDKLKPFFAYTILTGTLYESAIDMRKPLDKWIQDYAAASHKQFYPLETAEEQLNAFDKAPYAKQAAFLVRFVKDPGRQKKKLNEPIDLYLRQDIYGLYRKTMKNKDIPLELRRFLIDERDKVLADRIYHMISQKPTFCAIGAAHLAGKQGLIRQLMRMGCTVHPVYSEFDSATAIPLKQKIVFMDTVILNNRFRMPAPFSTTSSSTKSANGLPLTLYSTMFSDSIANTVFLVNLFDYSSPEHHDWQSGFIAEPAGNMAHTLNGAVIKDTTTGSGELTRRELVFHIPGNRYVRMKLFTKDRSGLQLIVLGAEKYIVSDEVNKFFDLNN